MSGPCQDGITGRIPFCRDRCKHLDLGAWASERFAMPQESPEDLPLMGSPDGQRLAD
ncbi:DNA gyrase inhibitor YacG [Hydrogenophaga sp.]|uniref:DNA gyrase inhibitor YacG n=1 Tax=Hydrogenophaga sp. TaxID=1904254 RepID=UPI0035B306BC